MRRAVPWLWCLVLILGSACSGASEPEDAGPDAEVVPDAGPPPPSMPAPTPLTDLVDPFLGTGGLGFNDLGSAFPGPQRPFGMVRPGPDTVGSVGVGVEFTHCAGYSADDEFISGFSHARMHGTGIPDYGNLALMPFGEWDDAYVDQTAAKDRIVEGSEEASVGYYAVELERGVRVELAASERVAQHRYTFEEGAAQGVLLDVGHQLARNMRPVEGSIEVDAETREVSGFTRLAGGYSGRFGGVRVFFVARFDRAFASVGTWEGETTRAGEASASGGVSGAWLTFDPSEGSVVRAEVAISFVDVEGARANLDAETAGFDLDAVRAATVAEWEAWLSRIRIHARTETDFRRFYTALYHSLLMPTLATDVDGRYRSINDTVETADFRYSTDFSLWDTFRTLHPLLTLAYPDVQTDMLRSLTQMAVDGGAMPRWPLGHGYTGGMLGEPAAITMADSWRKGLRDFDLRAAYDAMLRSAYGEASENFGGRGHAETYDDLGFVPVETGGWSASKTLEYAYGDWALSHLADALGEDEEAAALRERAGSWRNTWDPEREFFVGRHDDGRYVESFREDRWQDFYSEGNAWQFLWYVPHDLPGLAEQVGGQARLFERLDFFFAQSLRERRSLLAPEWYWHGNEPDLHASFVYAALGDTASTSRWSRWIAQTMYGDGPTGLPGNDDGGTLSAWLVFTTMGLYTIAGEDHYLMASPLATRTEIAVGDGVFTIEAPDASDAAPIVTAASVDGEALTDFRLPHEAIEAGSVLRLEMGPDASPAR
ncbi:MAG: GH92 family glycosyl hydrolase [Sandaracinaceae bacterium]